LRVPAGLVERIGTAAAAGCFGTDKDEVKVVQFPAHSRRMVRMPAPAFKWTRLAVAAVAVLGAVIAWVMPDFHERTAAAGAPSSAASTTGFTPRVARSGVNDIRDEGVVWTGVGQPLRKVRVNYRDHVTLRNARGELVEVEMPRTEYVLVPERVD
jgi:hypothetical protein